ncbi:FecCD family ABC transporter permease [Rhizobium rosettiformans]|uniref:FecCD family ABC transporter permease n=1 Tax=Rhizobium rosettiformans TaxID=1368430 RepID=UPI00285BEB39|nr:iron ABC transporter permease [Rhizobium rosettiformans]MDR7027989.1 iron complex transport system permease protein [Rhizobium rosettiformans]MDR7064729.1 iron complex transport system permease protein [Rhizobium rosettiformans]
MMQGRLFIWVGLALLLLALCLTAGVSLGSAAIPAETVWSILVNKLAPGTFEPTWSPGRESIVWDVRLPRVILAGLVGAGLATVGAVLQSVTRNPLADPHLLGVSSGGALGAIIALLHTGLIFGLVTVPLFAFAGSLLATLAVVAVTRFTGAGADRLVLSGVAIAFVATSLGNLAIFLGDPRAAHTVVFWMLGGLGLAQWSHLLYPAIVLVGCLTFLTIRAREINAMAMGDETAATLGVPVARFRAELFVVTALLTGVMVAFSGAIGFVGLLVPHFVRLTAGSDNIRVIPLSALTGAVILILADIVSRTIMAPEDMPIGVITGLAGGLAFIFLLRRR